MDPLATVDELEKHLGHTLDDQEAAEQALTLASGAVRAYCKWEISRNPAADMEVYGDGSHMITLPTLCLLDVMSIAVDGVDIGPLTRSVDLMWSRKGQIHRTEGWHEEAVVNLVVDHGFEPVPDAVKLVTLDAACRQLTNPENLVSATTGAVSRTWSSTSTTETTALSALHQVLLDNYRIF